MAPDGWAAPGPRLPLRMTQQPPGWGPSVGSRQNAVGRKSARPTASATGPGGLGGRCAAASGRLPPTAYCRVARRAVLGSVLALSAFLQFYRLGDWQFFSDDQAAELNVMHGMLVDHHPPLLGLALSVGHAHIGPLFYYLLALPLWLGHLDATAGVAMIGLFQVATVYLIYRLCLLVDAPWAGLCAAGLYATSGLVVYWSRFLWPNVTPFFVVLALYALVALAQGRTGYVVLLAGSLAAAAQMQPTALLLVPVAAIWLALWRPRVTPRGAALALGLAALLFAPVIIYDVTHHFAELRAWLDYRATLGVPTSVGKGAVPPAGLQRGLTAMEVFGWRVVGFRTRAQVDALLSLATLAVLATAVGWVGRPRAVLARLLLLWAGIYLLALGFYHGTLHPHYVEPLYPLPFLAVGLLLDLVVAAPLSGARTVLGRLRPVWLVVRPVMSTVLYLGTAVVVVGLATANVRHLWADHFGLDAYQLDSPAQAQGNEIMLGEMRQAAALIVRRAGVEPYNFWVAVRDGAGGGYQYLLRHSGAPPAATPRQLRFLLVEPADRPPWFWPPDIRQRWSRAPGGFMTLPHLLLWRLRLGPIAPGGDPGTWHEMADTSGAITALTTLPARVLAGFIGGPAESADGGVHWQRARWPAQANGLAVITGFSWSASCPQRLYAGTFDGVVVSRDGGAAWERLAAQPASTEVLALLADPRRCNVLLAGTRAGVAHTADGGRSWRLAIVGGRRRLAVHALVLGPDGHTVYAGTTDGVWTSADGGRSWPVRDQRSEPRPALCLLVHGPAGARLLAGSGAGVIDSGDGGVTWAPTGSGLLGTTYALQAVGTRGTLLAGTDAGLYVSHDDGAIWVRAALPADVTVKAFSAGGGRIYAASNRGLYRSTDDGLTWTRV